MFSIIHIPQHSFSEILDQYQKDGYSLSLINYKSI